LKITKQNKFKKNSIPTARELNIFQNFFLSPTKDPPTVGTGIKFSIFNLFRQTKNRLSGGQQTKESLLLAPPF
jgi:hypothetical protein